MEVTYNSIIHTPAFGNWRVSCSLDEPPDKEDLVLILSVHVPMTTQRRKRRRFLGSLLLCRVPKRVLSKRSCSTSTRNADGSSVIFCLDTAEEFFK